MTKTIHHTIRTLAAKHGVGIIEAHGKYRLVNVESQLLSEDLFDSAGEISEELRRNGKSHISWEKARATPDQRSGVMGISYHKAYSHNPHGPGSNDLVDVTLREETREVNADLQTGVETPTGRMDLAALHRIGEETGLFRREWETLNPGMQRMNLANRIRGWLRNHDDSIKIGGEIGRFGVELRVKKARKGQAEMQAQPAPKAEKKAKAPAKVKASRKGG